MEVSGQLQDPAALLLVFLPNLRLVVNEVGVSPDRIISVKGLSGHSVYNTPHMIWSCFTLNLFH
jgi:hypothetical protein